MSVSVVEAFPRDLVKKNRGGREKKSYPRTNDPPSSMEDARREYEEIIFELVDIEHQLNVRPPDLDGDAFDEWEDSAEAFYSMRKGRRDFLLLWMLAEQAKKIETLETLLQVQ